MLFVITVLAPALFLYFKYYPLELGYVPISILSMYLVIFIVKQLDKEGFFRSYSRFFFQQKLCQQYLYRALILEDFLLQNPFLILIGMFFLCVVFFSYIVLDPTPSDLLYWLSIFFYLLFTIYVRLRLSLINESYCNMYKEKNTFSWPDVIKGINKFLFISVPNRLDRTDYQFSHIYPKRSMQSLIRAVESNPEVTKATIAVAAATGTAAVAVATPVASEVRKALSTPEMKAVLEGKEQLARCTERAIDTRAALEGYPIRHNSWNETVTQNYSQALESYSKSEQELIKHKHTTIPALQEELEISKKYDLATTFVSNFASLFGIGREV